MSEYKSYDDLNDFLREIMPPCTDIKIKGDILTAIFEGHGFLSISIDAFDKETRDKLKFLEQYENQD